MRLKPVLVVSGILLTLFVTFVVLVIAAGSMPSRSTRLLSANKVGVVVVVGAIMDSQDVIEELVDFQNDHSVKAIVLRVDSPGGGVGPSQEIYEAVRDIRKIKPVVASMGSVAASGGYYIAAACEKIYANPGTMTGSIGVIMEFADLRELLGKIGVGTRVIKSGRLKDIGSPTRDMTPEEKMLLQGVIDDAYDQFVEAVAAGRHLDKDKVKAVADGRIMTGRQAQALQLVDELGGLSAAVRGAADIAGMSGDPQVVYPEEEKPSLMDLLMKNMMTSFQQSLQQRVTSGLQFRWVMDQ